MLGLLLRDVIFSLLLMAPLRRHMLRQLDCFDCYFAIEELRH